MSTVVLCPCCRTVILPCVYGGHENTLKAQNYEHSSCSHELKNCFFPYVRGQWIQNVQPMSCVTESCAANLQPMNCSRESCTRLQVPVSFIMKTKCSKCNSDQQQQLIASIPDCIHLESVNSIPNRVIRPELLKINEKPPRNEPESDHFLTKIRPKVLENNEKPPRNESESDHFLTTVRPELLDNNEKLPRNESESDHFLTTVRPELLDNNEKLPRNESESDHFLTPKSLSEKPKSTTTSSLNQTRYYYGKMTWKEAVEVLKDTKIGTFLIRDSSSSTCPFAISVQTSKGPTSIRIESDSSEFWLSCQRKGITPRFKSVFDLVNFYITLNDKDTSLNTKNSSCDNNQGIANTVWIDHNGEIFCPINIAFPLLKEFKTLQDLCKNVVKELPPNVLIPLPPYLKWLLNAT